MTAALAPTWIAPLAAAGIAGVGTALPPARLTNAELEQRLDTSDRWITERTGIRERRVGGSTRDLATTAARRALEAAGVDPATVELTVLATSTPDRTMPATATEVQAAVGAGGGALDVNAACAGFVYALLAAYGMVGLGAQRVLVIGADAMSRITDPDDRSTAILFGDGAGAVVLDATPAGPGAPGGTRPGLLASDTGCDGTLAHLLHAELGGSIVMEGREVFRQAVRATVESARRALDAAGLAAADVDVFVPHQANRRIIDAVADRLGISPARTVSVLDETGNTSAASIPLGLAAAEADGRLRPGAVVLLSGFGAGMSWATAVLRWGSA